MNLTRVESLFYSCTTILTLPRKITTNNNIVP